jgi:hypothetical protein
MTLPVSTSIKLVVVGLGRRLVTGAAVAEIVAVEAACFFGQAQRCGQTVAMEMRGSTRRSALVQAFPHRGGRRFPGGACAITRRCSVILRPRSAQSASMSIA